MRNALGLVVIFIAGCGGGTTTADSSTNQDGSTTKGDGSTGSKLDMASSSDGGAGDLLIAVLPDMSIALLPDLSIVALPDLSVVVAPADMTVVAVADMAKATTDMAKAAPDMAIDPRIACGANKCDVGMDCCVDTSTGASTCMASCPDAGVTISCGGPETCSGNPCCTTFSSTMQLNNVSCVASNSDCKTSLSLATQSGTTRVCHVDADCTAGDPSAMLPTCCTAVGTGAHICFSALYAQFSQGAITCP